MISLGLFFSRNAIEVGIRFKRRFSVRSNSRSNAASAFSAMRLEKYTATKISVMVPLTHAIFTALMTAGETGAIEVCAGKYSSTRRTEIQTTILTTTAIRTWWGPKKTTAAGAANKK